ncbi:MULTISPECIES: hypothetical protein [Candidatus Ichthyocystis]|uniref:Uncharacterized protein n=1 Tax=Candidatus Ichthyocystis hellenicum TaxID=1561003 RepID=A0A0S4M398_9BURK|nr:MULTISPECIES: hypothetical protein [Ichthyocystis]CUT17696.1 hypothetical protein Ark11_0873 [Candidatus Ichthyocystis hellenicum]
MDSINGYGKVFYVAQDGSCKNLETSDSSPLRQVVITGCPVVPTVSNLYFYSDHRCDVNVVTSPKFSDGSFLQEYALKCGYRFAGDFLVAMNRHRINFVNKVDLILACFHGNFNFLKDKGNSKNTLKPGGRDRSFFYKRLHDLRSKCVGVLKNDVIPEIIKIILDSDGIYEDSDIKMTYTEMERLFFYFVSVLEKLIEVKIRSHWNSFCSKNELSSSLISGIDCSKIVYGGDVVSGITHPVSFSLKFGRYISLLAIAKIDGMMCSFVGKCSNELERFVRSKCFYICNYSDSAVSDLIKLKSEIRFLIRKEFDKKIVEEEARDNFSSFLKKLTVWGKPEVFLGDSVLVFDRIVCCMYESLVDSSSNDLSNMVRRFQKKVWKARSRVSKGGRSFTTKDRWGIKLNPSDDYKIISIMGKFTIKYKDVIESKFCAMIRERYTFPDGSVISMVDWGKISKNLFPVAQEAVRPIVEMERAELCKFLFNVRVLEDDGVFDGYSAGTRRATSEEVDIILKIFINRVHRKNRELFSRIWGGIINSSKTNVPEDVSVELGTIEEDVSHNTTSTLDRGSNNDGDSLVTPLDKDIGFITLLPSELKEDKISNIWGLNLHPDDDRIITFIRKKFSKDISDHFRKLFSSMLESGAVLPSGKLVSDCSWGYVSSELCPIAIESVEPIFKSQYAELDRAVSKSRVVDVNRNNGCSCVIREITDDEKNNIMLRASSFIKRSLMYSVRSSWVSVTKNSKLYACRKSLGVKFRHSDDVAILNIRKRYSQKIKSKICDKFTDILKKEYKFDDGTVIGRFAWIRLSKKLLPIAIEEVKYIVEDEIKELEAAISRSRVFVDSGLCRELTDKEKSVVLGNIVDLVNRSLRTLSNRVWCAIVSSPVNPVNNDNNDQVSAGSESFVPANCLVGSSSSEFNFSYEDDNVIINIRKKFLSDVHKCVKGKFFEMLEAGYKFCDGTVIDRLPWGNISRRLLPVAKKEIESILEDERTQINDVLLRVQAVFLSSNGSSQITRVLTPEERSNHLDSIMKYAYRQSAVVIRKTWVDVIKLLDGKCLNLTTNSDAESGNDLKIVSSVMESASPLGFNDLSGKCREEFDNIRLEFIGNLGPIVSGVVDSSLLDGDVNLSLLDNINSDVAEGSCSLFIEMGFLERLKLLLSKAQLVEPSGSGRFITDEEKKYFFEKFMDSIASDRDYLIKNRVVKLIKNLNLTTKEGCLYGGSAC